MKYKQSQKFTTVTSVAYVRTKLMSGNGTFLKNTYNMTQIRTRAINRILDLTTGWTREELIHIEDTMELVALSYDVERAIKYIKL